MAQERKPIVFPEERPPIVFPEEEEDIFEEDELEEDVPEGKEKETAVRGKWRENLDIVLVEMAKNWLDAAKLNTLEATRNTVPTVGQSQMFPGMVGDVRYHPFGPKQTEEDKQKEQEAIDEAARELIQDIISRNKLIEELTPQELSTIEQGARTAAISLAMMAPGTIAALVARNPSPLLVSMAAEVYGLSYADCRAGGKDHGTCMLYSGADAAIEMATEYLPAKFLIRAFGPAIMDTAGNVSKSLLWFAITEMGGEQVATATQSLLAYKFDLDQELQEIEERPGLTRKERRRLRGQVYRERAAITAVAVLFQGSIQATAIKTAQALTEKEVEQVVTGEDASIVEAIEQYEAEEALTYEQEQLLMQDYEEYARKETILSNEILPENDVQKILLNTNKTIANNIEKLNALLREKEDIQNDPELIENPKKKRVLLNKKEKEIQKVEDSLERLEQTQLDFEGLFEDTQRIKVIDQELLDTEDQEIIDLLNEERKKLSKRLQLKEPEIKEAEVLAPIEVDPLIAPEEQPLLVLETTPEAQNSPSRGKQGFFSPNILKKYDGAVVNNEIAARIITAYNAIQEKLAAVGYASNGKINKTEPKLITKTKQDLINLVRLTKELINARLKNNDIRAVEKLAEISEIIERSEQPFEEKLTLPETLNTASGQRYRFLRTPKRVLSSNNAVIYRPKKATLAPELEMEDGENAPAPLDILFSELPFDADINLYFYNSKGEELMDPLTGEVFSAQYKGNDFIDPLSGSMDPNENLLPAIEIEGEIYRAEWSERSQSNAVSYLTNDPAMDPTMSDWKGFYRNPVAFGKFLTSAFRSWWTAGGVRPRVMAEEQVKYAGKLKEADRKISRLFFKVAQIQEKLAEEIDKGFKKIDDSDYHRYLPPGEALQVFKKLIAQSFRGNKDAQKKLGDVDQTLLRQIKKARKMISNNTRRILKLIKKLDPEGKIFTKEKQEVMDDSIERYIGRIFAAYVFPDWRAPNRKTASFKERALHKAAVTRLADMILEKRGRKSISEEEAFLEAEKQMDILYRGTGEERQEIFIEMFGYNPPYLTTEATATSIVSPALRARNMSIPKEVREALGEVDEPWVQGWLTAFKQEQFIAMTETLFNIAEIGTSPTNRFLSLQKQGKYKVEIKVEGDALNPLDGYFTTRAMALAIMKTAGYGPLHRYGVMLPFFPTLFKQPYLKLQAGSGLISTSYLVLSLSTQNRNYLSALAFPIMSGNWGAYLPKNLKRGSMYVRNYLKNITLEEDDFLVRQGVTGNSVRLGERYALMDKMLGMTTASEFKEFVEQTASSPPKRWAKNALGWAERVYLASDDVMKIRNYLSERDSMRRIFISEGIENLTDEQINHRIAMISELIEAAGGQSIKLSGSTPQENLDLAIRTRAAFLTRRNMPNYQRLPNSLDALKALFYSNFAGFPTAIVMSQANIMQTMAVERNLSLAKVPTLGETKYTTLKTRLQRAQAFLQDGELESSTVPRSIRWRMKVRYLNRFFSNVGWISSFGVVGASASAARLGLGLTWKTAKVGAVGVGVAGGMGAGSAAVYALSRFVADWAINNNFIFIKGPDEDDDGVSVIDGSYVEGFDLIGAPLRFFMRYIGTGAYMTAEGMEKMQEQFFKSLRNYVAPYSDRRIFLRILTDVAQNYDSETGKPIGNKLKTSKEGQGDPFDKWWKDRIEYLYEQAVPRVILQGVKIINASGEGEDLYDANNERRSFIDAISSLSGIRVIRIIPRIIIRKFKFSAFKNAADNDETVARNIIAYRAEDLSIESMDEKIKAYDDLNRKRIYLVRDLRLDIWHAAPALGADPEAIIADLEDSNRLKSISTEDQKNLTFKPSQNYAFYAVDPDYYIEKYEDALYARQAAMIKEGDTEKTLPEGAFLSNTKIVDRVVYFEQELYKIKDKYERVAEDDTPDYPITWGEPDWNSLVETFIARRNQNKSLVED